LQDGSDAANHDRRHESSGYGRVVHGLALNQRIGEQQIHHHPQQDMHRDDRRADAHLYGTDYACDNKSGSEGAQRGKSRLKGGPEDMRCLRPFHGLNAGVAARRTAAIPSNAASGGSHMMRLW
jgi:hypothetical protein